MTKGNAHVCAINYATMILSVSKLLEIGQVILKNNLFINNNKNQTHSLSGQSILTQRTRQCVNTIRKLFS